MSATELGIMAATWGVAMAVSPVLQIRTMVRNRSSANFSLGYVAVLIVGFALWIAYGLARRDIPLIVPNSVALVVMIVTLAIALRYR